MSAQDHPSGPADSMPQGPAPTAPTHTSQTGGPPQAYPVNNQNKDHQDPPEHNGTTNGSTRAPADSKGPGAAIGRNKTSEPHPGTSSGTGPATQPAESSKILLYVQHVGKVATGAEIALITIFVIFVGLPPTLHTCVELLNVDLDHQSVYTVVKLTIAQLIVGTD